MGFDTSAVLRIFDMYFVTNHLKNAIFSEKSQNWALHVTDQKPISWIENTCLEPIFNTLLVFKKFLNQNLDSSILDFLCYVWAWFWGSQIRLFAKSCKIVQVALNTKAIYENRACQILRRLHFKFFGSPSLLRSILMFRYFLNWRQHIPKLLLIVLFSAQKCPKNRKYRFGLQKGVKIEFQDQIRIRDNQILYGYICYFCKM